MRFPFHWLIACCLTFGHWWRLSWLSPHIDILAFHASPFWFNLKCRAKCTLLRFELHAKCIQIRLTQDDRFCECLSLYVVRPTFRTARPIKSYKNRHTYSYNQTECLTLQAFYRISTQLPWHFPEIYNRQVNIEMYYTHPTITVD